MTSFIILFVILPLKAFALIEVDITRGNLNPLPIAVSPLSIDKESKVNPLVDVADDGRQNEHIHEEGKDRHLALFVSVPGVWLIC